LPTEDLSPKDRPIRRVRRIVDEVLVELDGEFDAMYSRIGRPSIPQLLKATVLMALYSMRSERAFRERLNRPPSPRTGIGCWKPRSLTGSSPRWSAWRSCDATSRVSTSPSTGLC
jgi:hypothetical protein